MPTLVVRTGAFSQLQHVIDLLSLAHGIVLVTPATALQAAGLPSQQT